MLTIRTTRGKRPRGLRLPTASARFPRGMSGITPIGGLAYTVDPLQNQPYGWLRENAGKVGAHVMSEILLLAAEAYIPANFGPRDK